MELACGIFLSGIALTVIVVFFILVFFSLKDSIEKVSLKQKIEVIEKELGGMIDFEHPRILKVKIEQQYGCYYVSKYILKRGIFWKWDQINICGEFGHRPCLNSEEEANKRMQWVSQEHKKLIDKFDNGYFDKKVIKEIIVE